MAEVAIAIGIVALTRYDIDSPPESAQVIHRVNDRAGLISNSKLEQLSELLSQYENETHHQIVVLTIPSLDGEPIESFSLRTANEWGIGYAGLDNGVLITIATKERSLRIEVGSGLQDVITDSLASSILQECMIPEFRKGAFETGIERGLIAVMNAARKRVISEEERSIRR